MRRLPLILALLGVLALLAAGGTLAQQTTSNAGAVIVYPPPVYVLRGEVRLMGLANVPGMQNYYVEFRSYILPGTPVPTPGGSADQWLPAVFGAVPVTGTLSSPGVLGVWDTRLIPDGVYELRLRVNLTAGDPVVYVTGPVRIENNPPSFSGVNLPTTGLPTQALPTLLPTPTSLGFNPRPTLAPTQAGIGDNTPRVTARRDANVRTGDSTAYPVVGALLAGQTAVVLNTSANGTGWFYIQLPDGRQGWVAPSVVDTAGNFRSVRPLSPPPPPPPPTSTPVPFTATPALAADLGLDLPAIVNPGTGAAITPGCGVPFAIWVNVYNRGSAPNQTGFFVIATISGTGAGYPVQFSTSVSAIIQPFGNFVAALPAFTPVRVGGMVYTVTVTIGLNGNADQNLNNNTQTITYTLVGACS